MHVTFESLKHMLAILPTIWRPGFSLVLMWVIASRFSLTCTVKKFEPALAINLFSVWLRLHCAIYRLNSFVLMLRYCANLKAVRYESTSLNRIVADKSHRVIVAYA